MSAVKCHLDKSSNISVYCWYNQGALLPSSKDFYFHVRYTVILLNFYQSAWNEPIRFKVAMCFKCRKQKEESLIFRVTKTNEVSTAEKVTSLVITSIITVLSYKELCQWANQTLLCILMNKALRFPLMYQKDYLNFIIHINRTVVAKG